MGFAHFGLSRPQAKPAVSRRLNMRAHHKPDSVPKIYRDYYHGKNATEILSDDHSSKPHRCRWDQAVYLETL